MNKKYIEENYIELSDLAAITGFTENEILNLIDQEIIPNYSYCIETQETIQSSLDDEFIQIQSKKYFAKSHIEKLDAYKNSSATAQEIKESFKKNFLELLRNHPDKSFAYEGLFNQNESELEALLEETFETEWKHYCQGVYGICTLNAHEKEIVEKEIVIKKLITFNQKFENQILNEQQKTELLQLNKEFNRVTALFAPYQREMSSRGKYVDKILGKNDLNEFIKNYY